MWNPETCNFIEDIYDLASLGLPQFDADKELIYSMQRGSAVDHWEYTHKYIGGILTTIEETGTEAIRTKTDEKPQILAIIPMYDESHTLIYYYRKVMNENMMRLKTVEEKFRLYSTDEWELIAEYDGDSDVGSAIKKIMI